MEEREMCEAVAEKAEPNVWECIEGHIAALCERASEEYRDEIVFRFFSSRVRSFVNLLTDCGLSPRQIEEALNMDSDPQSIRQSVVNTAYRIGRETGSVPFGLFLASRGAARREIYKAVAKR